MRGQVLRTREVDYLQAAGAWRRWARIIGIHLLPAAFPSVLVQPTLAWRGRSSPKLR